MLSITVESNVSQQTEKVKREIVRRRGELLNVLGVQLLSNTLLAYNDKARGLTGEDGIRWKPLDPKTIKAKQRRGRGRSRSRRSRRGSEGGLAGPTGSTSTMIGVDTGLQRAAASPGYTGPDQVRNVDEQLNEVTVGFNRSYSEYFDVDRPLMPNDLPRDWENELDDIVQSHYEEIFSEFEE